MLLNLKKYAKIILKDIIIADTKRLIIFQFNKIQLQKNTNLKKLNLFEVFYFIMILLLLPPF
ncbi:MAG: hypothetical protein ABS28_06630 [Cryomorphaceae bacterium BACL22 MAG-120619-bin32]|nr:MAG: hypothetical protein ABS28_06630 [Cryomorphaceae bacterium BACL22 MAG-120619-bin32]